MPAVVGGGVAVNIPSTLVFRVCDWSPFYASHDVLTVALSLWHFIEAVLGL